MPPGGEDDFDAQILESLDGLAVLGADSEIVAQERAIEIDGRQFKTARLCARCVPHAASFAANESKIKKGSMTGLRCSSAVALKSQFIKLWANLRGKMGTPNKETIE